MEASGNRGDAETVGKVGGRMSDNEPRGLYDLGLDREVEMLLYKKLRPHSPYVRLFPIAEGFTMRSLLPEFLSMTPVQVMAIPGIGPKRFAHIERTLQRWGLALAKGEGE